MSRELLRQILVSEATGSWSRDRVMGELRKILGPKWFLKTSEEFDGRKGAIWTTGEETFKDQFLYDQDTGETHPDIAALLDKTGWFIEPYDAGTLMIYPG